MTKNVERNYNINNIWFFYHHIFFNKNNEVFNVNNNLFNNEIDLFTLDTFFSYDPLKIKTSVPPMDISNMGQYHMERDCIREEAGNIFPPRIACKVYKIFSFIDEAIEKSLQNPNIGLQRRDGKTSKKLSTIIRRLLLITGIFLKGRRALLNLTKMSSIWLFVGL